jgi:hypothetical protein
MIAQKRRAAPFTSTPRGEVGPAATRRGREGRYA